MTAIARSNRFAEIHDFRLSLFHIPLILNRCEAEMTGAGYMQVSVKVLDAVNDSVTFMHTGTGTQSDSIASLPLADRRMGFVGIAPRRASVDKCLELAGNVRPI